MDFVAVYYDKAFYVGEIISMEAAMDLDVLR